MIINIIGGCENLWLAQAELNKLIQKYLSILDPAEDELHSCATMYGICEAASSAAKRFGFRIEGYAPSVAVQQQLLDLSYQRITIIKGDWGDEVLPCIEEFERRGKQLYLTICFNGGRITKIFAEELIERNFAILLIAGSKRVTDELIGIYGHKPNVFVADLNNVRQIHQIILNWRAKLESI